MQLIKEINSFGDARKLIVQTMIQLRDKEIDVNRAMAIAANMKVLNDSFQAEINANKLAIIAHDKGHEFGRLVSLGTRLIDG